MHKYIALIFTNRFHGPKSLKKFFKKSGQKDIGRKVLKNAKKINLLQKSTQIKNWP